MNDSCPRGIPPGGRVAAALGVGKQPVTLLPGLTDPAERIEGRATPWRAPCSVGVQAEADLGRLRRGVTPPAAAAVAAAVPRDKQDKSGAGWNVRKRGC